MSLGVRSLWRAQSRRGLSQGLSLVLRVSRDLPACSTFQPRCWLSSPADSPAPTAEPPNPAIRKVEIDQGTKAASIRDETRKSLRSGSAPTTTARGRLFLHQKTKTQPLSSRVAPMIKPPIPHLSRRARNRALSRHIVSKRRQALLEYHSEVLDKPPNNWRSTLDFMIRHTPKVGEIMDFKVKIGNAAAARARATLSDLDTNIWQIQQRHNCKIHVESGSRAGEPFVLSLSGSSVSIRGSLLELVKVIGRVSAVKVLDPTLPFSSPTFWGEDYAEGQMPITLLRDGESAAEDDIMTIYGIKDAFMAMTEPPNYKPYKLIMRADEIPRPTIWTKSSFEQYVAKLVFGQVPNQLHWSLYPVKPDHQTTVVEILVSLFSSEESQAAMSLTALKMALQYIHARGSAFRPAARTLSIQAEQQHLTLDVEIYQDFLTSASKGRDLQGFNSVLKAMHKKGHYVRPQAWVAFLEMIEDPVIKRRIMAKMRGRGMDRLEPVLAKIGGQEVVLELEESAGPEINVQRLVDTADSRYGRSWLNAMTLNRIIHVLGAREKLEACHELLDLVGRDQRVQPDQYTLNTMMSHTRSISGQIALLSRLPEVRPNERTYHQLFQAAWKQRLPNMLRVIWRYAVFSNLTNSQMRQRLSVLLRRELLPSKQHAFLQEWEGVVFGRHELVACGEPTASGFEAVHSVSVLSVRRLMEKYMEDAGAQRPLASLGSKLQEAYEMDMRIHKLNREGADLSPSVQDSLTVEVPLGLKERLGHKESGEKLLFRRQLK
ncbi:hypothetical protein F5Y08DRAFT_258337 [Xylaria arbuscula]|nr:hypothetical protein F5Y08DRAFT_258337 [Xylaria arbuscula]